MEEQQAAHDYSNPQLQEHLAALSHDQLRYVLARLRCSSKKAAAKEVGISYNTVLHWPPSVDETVGLLLLDTVAAAQGLLVRTLGQAVSVKAAGLESDNEATRHKTATEILDRVLGHPAQSVDLRHDIGGKLAQFMRELVDLNDGTDEDEPSG